MQFVYMERIDNQTDKLAALCGMIWYVFIIDACFTWFFTWDVRYFIGAPFVFYATILLSREQGLVFSDLRHKMFVALLLLTIFGVIGKFEIFVSPIRYAPLMCIVFWRESALIQMYEYFKKFILFYAVLSIIVEILVLTKTWTMLPYKILPPQDNVQEQLGYVNYFFGLYNIQSVDTSLDFYRACGPGREGGHFAIYLGFLYFSETAIFNKRYLILIICGILTLSPNFLFALIITEGYCAIKEKRIFKPLLMIFAFVATVIFAFILSPQDVQVEIVRVILERSLESNYENMESDGLMAFLDGRTGGYGVQHFNMFLKKDFYTQLVGLDEMPKGNVMSDYRYMIMQRGFIGAFLSLWCIYVFSIKIEKSFFGFCLMVMALLVFIHRSWMFFQVYWWTTMLLIVTVKQFAIESQETCQESLEFQEFQESQECQEH